MKPGGLRPETSSSASNGANGAQVLPAMVYAGGLDLAKTAHATISGLQLSLLDLLGAQLERNAALLGRLAACRTVEAAFDVYMAYAAATLVHYERGLTQVIDAGTRVTNRTVVAGLQPLLAVRRTPRRD